MSEEILDLSPEEQRVLYYWSKGKSMTDAYKHVMLSAHDAQSLTEMALKKRVSRFFGTYRMRAAMAAVPGKRGEKAKTDFDKWMQTQKDSTVRKLAPDMAKLKEKIESGEFENSSNESDNYEYPDNENSNEVKANQEQDDADVCFGSDWNQKEPEEDKKEEAFNVKKLLSEKRIKQMEKEASLACPDNPSDKQKWLASLQVNEKPSALTIYGTGQFLTYIAVKEVMERQAAIKAQGIGVLEKNGSALTQNIISAFKTAAAMILPFAPAPTTEERKEMSKAAILLGLMPDQIQENPDDYTAPPPVIIDVTDKE